MIQDTSKHPQANTLEVTEQLNIKSFIGAPIVLNDGTRYGTLCAMDQKPFIFEEKHASLLKAMASLLAYTVDLEQLSMLDPLTKLYNRTHLNRIFQQLTENSDDPFYLCYLDFDDFKAVNDQFGHYGGDQLLKIISTKLKACLDKEDLVSRIGGDEFVLIIKDISHQELIVKLTKLLTKLNEIYIIDDLEIHVTPSIGVSSYSQDADTLEKLMKQADQAMYTAKKLGGNQIQFFEDHL